MKEESKTCPPDSLSLLNAELKAAQKFGKRKLNSLCMLRDEYLDVLQNEFIKEKLLNNSKDI